MILNKTKFNCVTGSPPKCDTLLASWYPTYMQSFIISHSSCAEQYGEWLRTHRLTHSHTIKPPTVGVRQVGHTSIRDIQRRSSIQLPSARDRVATAAQTVTASRLWSAMSVKKPIHFVNVFKKNVIGSLGHNNNLTHCWHHGTRHT